MEELAEAVIGRKQGVGDGGQQWETRAGRAPQQSACGAGQRRGPTFGRRCAALKSPALRRRRSFTILPVPLGGGGWLLLRRRREAADPSRVAASLIVRSRGFLMGPCCRKELIRENPHDVIQFIEEEGVAKLGEFSAQVRALGLWGS